MKPAFLKSVLARPGMRTALRIAGLAVLVAGGTWAVATLDLTWSDLSPWPLAANLLVATPALLWLSSLTFQITARAIGRDVSARRGLQVAAGANVAELLPLPGGALVRGAALVGAGAGAGEATRVVLLTSVLTLGVTIAVSSTALAALSEAGWLWLTAASTVGCAVVLALLARSVDARYLPAMVAVRLAGLVLTAARLMLAFAMLGEPVGWIEAALYAVAPTLGAAVGIVPAGLGVNEAIAASLAVLVAASPGAAFLAVASNRAFGLVVGGVMAVLLDRAPREKQS